MYPHETINGAGSILSVVSNIELSTRVFTERANRVWRVEQYCVGIGRCLTTLSPPRNRAGDFYRTRLLGFTLWSWSLPPKHDLHTLTVYGYWRTPISTFSQPLGGFTFSSSEASCSTSAPFQVGQCPIQPVMPSRCLSAAGLRFLEHPVPTEDFRRSYVRPTDPRQTSVGFPRSAPSSRDWGGCLLYSGVVVSLLRSVCEPLATAADHLDLPADPALPSCSVIVSGNLNSRSLTEDSLAFTRPVFPWPGSC